MTWYQIIGSCIASFAFGYMLGMFDSDAEHIDSSRDNYQLRVMNKMQKARGDHWFHEYQKMILQHEDSD